MFDFKETTKDGKTCHFTWVTDLALNEHTVAKVAKAGQTRWRIENETFNTLKKQGYNFEHNYGHGNQFLSTNFSNLMLLAFFIDQIQQRCCYDFKLALEEAKRKLYFWEKLRFFALNFAVDSWGIIYGLISKKTTYKMVLIHARQFTLQHELLLRPTSIPENITQNFYIFFNESALFRQHCLFELQNILGD